MTQPAVQIDDISVAVLPDGKIGVPVLRTSAAGGQVIATPAGGAVGVPSLRALGTGDIGGFAAAASAAAPVQSVAGQTGAVTDLSAATATATGSTTARTLADRAADWVNVLDEGAVFDGATDDATANQAAITKALGYTNGGGITLARGISENGAALTGTFTGASSLSFYGQGQQATVLHFTADAGGLAFTTSAGTSNGVPVTLQDFEITTNAAAPANAAISLTNTTFTSGQVTPNSDISRLHINGDWPTGIAIAGQPQVNITDILAQFPSSVAQVGVSIQGNGTSAISTQYMLRNYVQFEGNVGVELGNYIQGIVCDSCTFVGANTGVLYTNDASNEYVSINNCSFNCKTTALDIGNATTGVAAITISNSFFYGSPSAGIMTIQKAIGLYISNCFMETAAAAGTALSILNSANVVVTGGQITATSGSTIDLTGSSDVQFIGVHFSGIASATVTSATVSYVGCYFDGVYYAVGAPSVFGGSPSGGYRFLYFGSLAGFYNSGGAVPVEWNGGYAIEQNYTGGGNEVDFFYNPGGISFYSYNGSAAPTASAPAFHLDSSGNATVGATLKTKAYTVATLPTGVEGMRAYVTDATSPTFLGALTGGGAVICPVFYNGTAWVVG